MTELENLQALVKEQGEQIKNYKELVECHKELVKEQGERIAELKRDFVQARWIAIYEFLVLLNESKGEILNSRYVQSSWEWIGITLNEETLMWMGDYAKKHFEMDAEYTKKMQTQKGGV